jgi:hypothetical protein
MTCVWLNESLKKEVAIVRVYGVCGKRRKGFLEAKRGVFIVLWNAVVIRA